MKSERIELFSEYSPAECAARLTDAIDTESVASFGSTAGSKTVLGRVSGSSFNLRKRIDYRNSFQSSLTGTLHSCDGGTLVLGSCGLNPFVLVFMCVWLSGVVLIGGPVFAFTLSSPHPFSDQNWVGLAVPAGMFVFGILLWRFGAYLARQEARFLTDFVAETLKARPNFRKV